MCELCNWMIGGWTCSTSSTSSSSGDVDRAVFSCGRG